jgi:hypothetical protein
MRRSLVSRGWQGVDSIRAHAIAVKAGMLIDTGPGAARHGR